MTDEQYKRPSEVDWEAIERDYRAGVLSLREIAAKHGMSPKSGHVAIKRKAESAIPPWERDLNAKIQAKADDIVRKQVAAKEKGEAAKLMEPAIIEANAQAIVQVRMAHRTDIARSRELGAKLRVHLEHLADNHELYARLGELMYSPDDKGKDKLNEIYMATIELPTQVKMLKDLASAMDSLINLERQAYNIGEESDGAKADGAMRHLTDAERVTRLQAILNRAKAKAEATKAEATKAEEGAA